MSMDMFEFMFGWRKASKCKKLIRKLHCRLNLLKNKRCCMVRQLRNDVAELIKHGHYQSAFNRVDQIYKDECLVKVYDQLALFCEFINLQLSYIRRNKDCPNDVNEAISTLIFASARCGDLPELLQIRKLFTDRYGEQFQETALELGRGNLVNSEIKEKLSFKKVSNEEKYKLMDEITATVLQTAPLALEYTSELHQKETKSNVNLALEFTSEQHQQAVKTNAIETEGTRNEKIVPVDFDHTAGDENGSINHYDTELSEDLTANEPEEIVYRDEIIEFQSPFNNCRNGEDKRVFVFSSSAVVPVVDRRKQNRFIDFHIEKSEALKMETKGSRKSRKRLVSSVIGSPSYYHNTSHRRKAGHENRSGSGIHSPISTFLSGHEDVFVKQSGEMERAITMPVKGSTKWQDENSVMRSNSFPVPPSPPHVHPKLPDYDELAAKFMALKKENMQQQK